MKVELVLQINKVKYSPILKITTQYYFCREKHNKVCSLVLTLNGQAVFLSLHKLLKEIK